jgi:hypothetical protein
VRGRQPGGGGVSTPRSRACLLPQERVYEDALKCGPVSIVGECRMCLPWLQPCTWTLPECGVNALLPRLLRVPWFMQAQRTGARRSLAPSCAALRPW